MADRNNLKIADAADLADDDPFAELTRIMGFDPREPAKLTPAAKLGPVGNPGQAERVAAPPLEDIFGVPEPEAAAPVQHEDVLDDLLVQNDQAVADESLQADFSIDLEQELMGGLDFDALGDELEYASEPVAEVAVTSGAAAYEVQADDEAPSYQAEPEFDPYFDLADNLDDALVEAVGHEPEAQTQWQDRAGAVDFNELIGSPAPAVQQSSLSAEDEQAVFDRDIDARFDMLGDFEFEGDGPAVAVAAVEPEAYAPAEADAPETDETLDFVLHEDELRFDDDAFQLDIEPHASAAPEVEPLANDFLKADAEGDYAPAGYERIEAVAIEPQDYAEYEEVEATAYQPVETTSYEPVAADQYEDDNAGGYEAVTAGYEPEAYEVEPEPAHAAPVYQRASYSAPSYATAAPSYAPVAAAEPSYAAVEPGRVPAQDFDFTLEDELNALLGNTPPSRTTQPIYAEAAEPESLSWNARDEALQAAAVVDSESQDYDDADYAPAMKDYSLPVAGGEEDFVDFDHDAFDAAIAKGFDGDELDMFADHEAEAPLAEKQTAVIDRATPQVDPLQTIEALSAHYGTPGAVPAYRAPAAYQDVPEIETIEVSDRAVALADDLDIPEIPQQEEFPPISAYDDLDSEFAGLLNNMNTPEGAAQRPTATSSPPFADPVSAPAYDYAAAAASVAAISAATLPLAGARPVYNEAQSPGGDFDFSDTLGAPRAPGGQYQPASFDYDPQLDDEMTIPSTQLAEERPRSRRGMMIAAIVGGVAVLGGVGAFALSFGDSSGSASAPVVVKADETPIKVRPTNPGGSTVPNQENKVYDAVRGTDATGAPQQEKLVTTAEEPVDMTPPAVEEDVAATDDTPAMSGAPKGEDRIEQIVNDAANDSDAEVAAVAPRKVRTMVVRPDGTLVPREDPAPVEAAAPVAPPEAPMEVAATETAPPTMRVVEPESTGTVAEQPAASGLQQAADDVPAQAAPVARQSSTTPDVVPIAPQRPSEQPVEVVGEVKADQVAALAPAAAAAGSWSMQIASQPSEAAAQSSYQDLVRRYGSVLNGRQANIVKAEIAGKGTFWRVRVPANSRNDAISLCESYKAAGGNCFVSR